MLEQNSMISQRLLHISVIPAKAGNQVPPDMDSRMRGNDEGFNSCGHYVLDSNDNGWDDGSCLFSARGSV